jgi:DNA-binding response OmpR family regulator
MLMPELLSLSGRAEIVVLCPEAETARYRAPLAQTCHVATTASPEAAIQYLTRVKPSLLIVDGDRNDFGVPVCDAANAFAPVPSILVTLSQPEAAGQVIDRCDSVLLKPFAPNLLSSRVGRLLSLRRSRELRVKSDLILERVHLEQAKGNHLRERMAGTLVGWPSEHCHYCDHSGVILFDHSSHRRSWYACPQCRKVWLAKRLEAGL